MKLFWVALFAVTTVLFCSDLWRLVFEESFELTKLDQILATANSILLSALYAFKNLNDWLEQ